MKIKSKKRKEAIDKKLKKKIFENRKRKMESIPTTNGKIIYRFMKRKRVKGNYKDYVLVFIDSIIDWKQKWSIVAELNEKIDKFNPILMHKSLLKYLIGEENAAKIWHPTLGRIPTSAGIRRQK